MKLEPGAATRLRLQNLPKDKSATVRRCGSPLCLPSEFRASLHDSLLTPASLWVDRNGEGSRSMALKLRLALSSWLRVEASFHLSRFIIVLFNPTTSGAFLRYLQRPQSCRESYTSCHNQSIELPSHCRKSSPSCLCPIFRAERGAETVAQGNCRVKRNESEAVDHTLLRPSCTASSIGPNALLIHVSSDETPAALVDILRMRSFCTVAPAQATAPHQAISCEMPLLLGIPPSGPVVAQ